MFCTQCGKELPEGVRFCIYCGAKTRLFAEEAVNTAEPENEALNDEINTEQEYSAPMEEKSQETIINEEPVAFSEEEKQKIPYTEPSQVYEKPKKKINKLVYIIGGVIAAVLIGIGIYNIDAEERGIYREAKALMEEGEYYKAEEKFASIMDYKKSDELYNECFNKARYEDAVSRIKTKTRKNAEIAQDLLTEIKGYEDSDKLLKECDLIFSYCDAEDLLNSGDYEGAKEIYESIGDYDDCTEKVTLCENYIAYNDALEDFENLDYESAKDKFSKISDFLDSGEKYDYCVNMISYKAAVTLFEEGNYEEARNAFSTLGDFEESQKYVDWCDVVPIYEEATEYFEKENYTKAKELFKQCNGFKDSDSMYSKCVTYESAKTEYDKALALYNEGKYYSAKVAFEKISGYKDADKKAANCVRSLPSSGEIYHNSSYSSSAVYLKISAPSSMNAYLKLYKGGTLISTVFIRKGGSASVNLPSGTYTIDADYGSTWYGTKETFGPSGSYCTLLNGSSTSFSLASGSWSLQLLASTSGNVGSKSRSWGS